jgi:hypothetical protein
VRRLLVLAIVAIAALTVPFALGASGAGDGVSIATVTPAAGPAGTVVGFTLAGTDAAGTEECLTSSAYRLEFLTADGSLGATGGDTVAVPADAKPGAAAIRLVCYVPDATGRRVIHGLCGRFAVTDAGAALPAPSAASIPCPPAPRLALGQSVIAVEHALSAAFNQQLFFPLSK